MCDIGLEAVAQLLRPVSIGICSGSGKLCLSTNYLHKLNTAFEAIITEDLNSFQLVQSRTQVSDVQFLWNLVKGTVALKVTLDLVNDQAVGEININRFNNLKTLEIHKVDIKTVIGIQKLRSQLHQLVCSHCLNNLADMLDKCGGDNSHGNLWSELKRAVFSHNSITSIDSNFELTPWLNVLDLSYNQLHSIEILHSLPGLKHLNISYNKLEKAPKFKGQICSRLQVLILTNNFIEDLSGLMTLTNLTQLDLYQNCLLDHKVLLSISHLSSLQLLNLKGNPICCHPHHRNLTCNHLHKNTASTKFVLDNIPLNKAEKSLVGSLYPIAHSSLSNLSHSLESSISSSIQERQKRIRNVIIKEGNFENKNPAKVAPPVVPSTHLQIKRQVEQLRQEYGESWLYRHSGLMVQDVLGFEKSSVLSSTPSETGLDSLYLQKDLIDSPETLAYITAESELTKEDTKDFETVKEEISDTFSNKMESEGSDVSDGEDVFLGGENGIFLATFTDNCDDYDILIVVTDSHISERNVTTSKEKARWHVNTVLSCEQLPKENGIKLIFDTVRRDRKERVYFLEDAETFLSTINDKIPKDRQVENQLSFQCMKCSEVFVKSKINGVSDEPIMCPKCDSTLVVENQ